MPTPRSLTTAPHRDFDLEVVAGEWPTDISGDVLYSSPSQRRDLPYAIFSFGSTCRLSLEPGTRGANPGRFRWQSVPIETPGQRLWSRHRDQFTPGPTGYTSPFGPPNCANTAPLPWGDRLYATWDGGRPVELHPGTLEFVAEVGHVDSWGGSSLASGGVLPFLLSSAHPVVDPERDCMWTAKLDLTIGPSVGLQPSLVRYDREDGTRVRRWPLDGITFGGSTHTVSQTRDWLILCDSGNFKVDIDEILGGERTTTIDTDVPVWLIRKDTVEDLPSGTPITPIAFTMSPPNGHFYARWEDRDGISVVWEGMDLMDLGFSLRPDDTDVNGQPIDPAAVGLYNMGMAPETIVEVVFDPDTGKVIERGIYKEDWTFNLQLSAMDWSIEGQTDPTLHHVAYQGCRPASVSARAARLYEDRIDLASLRVETPGALCSFARGSMELEARWEYPDTADHITSPAFAPRAVGTDPTTSAHAGRHPGGHDGYVVQPVCNDDGLRIELFDAGRVGEGPIATLMGTAKETIPLVLHAAWTPAQDHLVDARRLDFAAELSDAALASVPEELRPAVLDVAAELAGGARR